MVAWLRGVADYNAAFGAERRGTDAAVQLLRDAGIPINPSTQLPRFQPDGRFDVGTMSALLDWYIAEGVVRRDRPGQHHRLPVGWAARRLGWLASAGARERFGSGLTRPRPRENAWGGTGCLHGLPPPSPPIPTLVGR